MIWRNLDYPFFYITTLPLHIQLVKHTGSALAAASDIHWQVPTNMASICRDWLTNQNTNCCFVVIGLCTRQSHSPLQQLKIDTVRQLGPPYSLASSGCQRMFINICGQYGIQKNIYIHLWLNIHVLRLIHISYHFVTTNNCLIFLYFRYTR